jgi:hypothetical protein
MKYLALLLFICLGIYSSNAQNDSSANNSNHAKSLVDFRNNQVENRLNEIVASDTVIDDSTGKCVINSYDVKKVIVQTLTYNIENNQISGYIFNEIFNSSGKIIFDKVFIDNSFLPVQQHEYTYNKNGQLIQKSGWGAGEISNTKKYYYSKNGKLINTKIFYGDKEE